MGDIKVTLFETTLNKLDALRDQFGKSRNLGGLLRIIAIQELAKGASIREVADTVRTSDETVRVWLHDFLAKGTDSLLPKKSPGRPKVLTQQEEKKLSDILGKSPEDAGFRGGCWDSKKVRQFILKTFGKKLALKYIPELLKSLGFSFKKARVEISRRDDLNILREQWIELKWPKILEVAESQDAHILFGDEAYFSIFGTTSYTWSLTHMEPTVKSSGSKENLHVVGAINYQTGKTHAIMTDGMVDEDVFICFVKTLLAETRKHIHLIVDNAGYHKSAKVMAFLQENIARITIHFLPPYSPDYNPIEGLWKKIKKETTHNVYFESLEALWEALVKELKRFRNEPSEIKSLFGFYEDLLEV